MFVGHFCRSGSGSGLRIRIRLWIQGPHWIRIGLFLHDGRRIWIREAQKHVDPVDPDPDHCSWLCPPGRSVLGSPPPGIPAPPSVRGVSEWRRCAPEWCVARWDSSEGPDNAFCKQIRLCSVFRIRKFFSYGPEFVNPKFWSGFGRPINKPLKKMCWKICTGTKSLKFIK